MNTEREPSSARKPEFGQEGRIPEASYEIIAELAYLKAENRQFEPGHELDDWLEAEKEYLMNNKKPEARARND